MKHLGHIGILFPLFFLAAIIAQAQPGTIIETGDQVLDPNQDGYVSATSAGFSGDGYDVDEFEIKMFGIPIFGDGEALRDISGGAQCGVSDLALDVGGYALYAAYDDNQNIIFRMRVAGNRPSVQSYSIMIDTDGLIGLDDPNSNTLNPGFEVEVTLIHNFGVYIYAIDGIESCPTPVRQYDVDTHQQKSISSVESCETEDYFIDFYIPLQDLIDIFGIDEDTELKYVGLTNISATCALAGKISDIGGVDDTDYDGCFQCAILDLVENQCPSTISNLCETCAGFPEGATETPDIDRPVIVGSSEITGTAEPSAEIFIDIFSDAGALLQSTNTSADIEGVWLSGQLDNQLTFGDSIVVNAKLPGKCESGLNDAGLSIAIVSPNQPPIITGSPITISYTENGPPVVIDETIEIEDDNNTLKSGSIIISQNLEAGSDLLNITPPPGVNVLYLLSEGKILLDGEATPEAYAAAFQTVTFENTNESPDQEIRQIDFQVFDGLNFSTIFSKNLLITEVNDPPVIIIGGEEADTVVVSTPEDIPIQVCLDAEDVDSNIILITSTQIVEGGGTISDIDGTCFLFTPAENESGTVYVEAEICDNGTPQLCDIAVVEIIVTPVNDPPVVEENDIPTQTVHFTTLKNSPFDFCLDVTDIEGDNVSLQAMSFDSNNGSAITNPSGVCFSYTPGDDFVGLETISVTLCDDGDPQACITFTIEIEVVATNEAPVIVADTMYFETNKNVPIEMCIAATDADGDDLSISLIENLNATSTNTTAPPLCVTYDPATDFVGTEILKVVVCDDVSPALCDTVFLKINVKDINNPPGVYINGIKTDTVYYEVKVNEVLDVCLPFSDPDNDLISLTTLVNETGEGFASLTNGLCFSYTAAGNPGMVWLTTNACDNGDPVACSDLTIGIDVIPTNSPPVITDGNTTNEADTLFFVVNENEQLPICLDVYDLEGDDISISDVNTIEEGGFYLPGPDGECLIFVPNDDFSGQDVHVISVCDSGDPEGCDDVVIVVDVLPFNHAPFVVSDGIPTDTLLYRVPAETIFDFCIEAVDEDGDPLLIKEFDFDTNANGSTLVIGAGLCFQYTPSSGFLGIEWFAAKICDDKNPGLCDDVVVGIEVYSVNNPPRITFNGNSVDSLRVNGFENVPMSFTFDVFDEENDALQIKNERLVEGTGLYSIQLNSAVQIDYTPADRSAGIHRLRFGVCDDGLPSLCDSVQVAIDVVRINQAPEGTPDEFNTLEGETVTGNILDNDTDPDGDSLVVESAAQLQLREGLLDIDNTGFLSFTPTFNYSGVFEFEYIVRDIVADSKSDTVQVTITVDPIDKTIKADQAVSPNGDGYNDFWLIQNIEYYPNNRVLIFDRWNNRVYEAAGYDNSSIKWTGQSNLGLSRADVADGTYFYVLTPGDGQETISGMVVLKR